MAVQAAGFDTRRVSDSQVEPWLNRSSKAEPTQGIAAILAGWMSTGGAATKAVMKQMAAARSVGIMSAPNQPT